LAFEFDTAVQAPFLLQPGLRQLAPGTAQLTLTAAPQRGLAAVHQRLLRWLDTRT